MFRTFQEGTDFSDSEVEGSALAGQASSVSVHFSVNTHDAKKLRLRMHVSNLPAGHTEKDLLKKVQQTVRGVQCSGIRSLQESLDRKAQNAIERVFMKHFEGIRRGQITRVDEPCSLSTTTMKLDWKNFQKSNPSECELTTWSDLPLQVQSNEICTE